MREKELEKERLREIALEFKQSGAFSSIAQQSQSFQLQDQTLPLLSSFATFNSFPMTTIPPVVETPQPPPREISQAYLEAVEASKRIAASKNFVDVFSCSNSNDSTSNGPSLINEGSSNSSRLILLNEKLKKKIQLQKLNGYEIHVIFSCSQGMLSQQDSERSDHVGVAVKMTRHSSRACRPFCRHHLTHTNRKPI